MTKPRQPNRKAMTCMRLSADHHIKYTTCLKLDDLIVSQQADSQISSFDSFIE